VEPRDVSIRATAPKVPCRRQSDDAQTAMLLVFSERELTKVLQIENVLV